MGASGGTRGADPLKADKAKLFANLKDYTASAEIGTVLTTAIRDVWLAGGGTVVIPTDLTYTISTPVVLKPGVSLVGASPLGAKITATGQAFDWTSTINFVTISNLRVNGSGGHIFSSSNGSAIYCVTIEHCYLQQNSDGYSILNHVSAIDYDKVAVVSCDLYHTQGATVPAWYVSNSGGAANENKWEFLRAFGADNVTRPFFQLENTSNAYAWNNQFSNITGEKNPGGLIHVYSCRNIVFDTVKDWDSTVGNTADMIKVGGLLGSGTSPKSRNVRVNGCGIGVSGLTPGGIYDVNLVPGQIEYATVTELHKNGTDGRVNFSTSDKVNLLNAPSTTGWSGQPAGVTNYFGNGLQIQQNLYVGPKLVDAALANDLASGEILPPRHLIGSGVGGPGASGVLVLNYFTASKTEAINTLAFFSGNTAAGATPTLIRYGVYSSDDTGNLTLLASTANDTSLFAAVNTAYPKALSATWSKLAGQRYAVGILVVTAAAVPTMHGLQLASTGPVNTLSRLAPAIAGRVTAQSDLPSSVSVGSIVGFQFVPAVQLS